MGHTTDKNVDARETQHVSFVDSQDGGEWFVDFDDAASLDAQRSPSPSPVRQIPARPSSAPSPGLSPDVKKFVYALPLESQVFDPARDFDLPLNFLNVYPAILLKFPGPPIEALGRTISYLQALFTESPGFHPFITHLSIDSPPANDIIGKRIAETLERRLIRIIQHLFSFFYGDVNSVKQYMDACRPELVPRPLFVLSSQFEPAQMTQGVQGYNNGVSGGANLWQSPLPESVWSRHLEQQALQENIRKCNATINRKQAIRAPNLASGVGAGQRPQPRAPLQCLPPLPPPQPPLSQQFPPAPQFSQPQPQQFPFPLGPPAHPGQIPPITPMRSVQPPQIFHVPPPPIHQMQLPVPNQSLPQPNIGPQHPPAPISAPTQAMQPPPHTMPSIITRSASAPGNSFKDDINRLETQMSRLLQLVESKSRQ